MPPRGWSAALGLVAACTSLNPAYEATGDTTVGGQAESTGALTSEGDTTGPASIGDTASTAESADETQASEDGSVQETCLADMYAISEVGTLYLLDVDAGTAIPMIDQDPELTSWALATHPETGLIYVSKYTEPATMWTVSPVVFTRDQVPMMVPHDNTVDIARAAFTPGRQLWLGTDDTNLFLALDLVEGTAVPFDKPGMGRGGDLLFLEENIALLPSLDGNVWLVRFDVPDAPIPFPITLEGMPGIQLFTGIARDLQGRPWAGTVDGLLVRLEIDELPAVPPSPVEVLELGITINDLAPIVVPPGGC